MGKRRAGPLFGKSQQEQECTLESLMRDYGTDVLRMAYLYVKDIHTAEDMFQEVFLKVNEKLYTFEGKSEIKTWLLRITINTCKDYLKSAYHNKVIPMEQLQEEQFKDKPQSRGEDGYERLEKEETAHTVKEAVMELPECYRDTILCVYFQEMSLEEAARALKVSTGTVKSRLSRAKGKLRQALEGRLELSDE